ncbi:hypothetical protein SALBM311S_04575 [Streptomyces alboniger]
MAGGDSDGEQVVAHDGGGSAGGGHQRAGVGSGDADTACGGGCSGVAVGPAEVERVADRDRPDPVGVSLVDGQFHRLVAGELAESVPGVQYDDGACVRDDLSALPGADRALAQPLDVHRHEQHAVRRGAAEIRLHQAPGHRRRGPGGKARGYEHRADGFGQPVGRDTNTVAHSGSPGVAGVSEIPWTSPAFPGGHADAKKLEAGELIGYPLNAGRRPLSAGSAGFGEVRCPYGRRRSVPPSPCGRVPGRGAADHGPSLPLWSRPVRGAASRRAITAGPGPASLNRASGEGDSGHDLGIPSA